MAHAYARQPGRAGNVRISRWLGVIMLTGIAVAAFAECATDAYGDVYCGGGQCIRDRHGTVWCSRFYEGGAQLTRDGKVVCGRGQCAKSTRGEVFCSSVAAGAVLKDSRGQVRCMGRCEPGSAQLCENTRADSAG